MNINPFQIIYEGFDLKNQLQNLHNAISKLLIHLELSHPHDATEGWTSDVITFDFRLPIGQSLILCQN